jgi:hypothetical protein
MRMPELRRPDMQTPRYLLAASSAILALGGLMHARAFRKALAAANASDLPEFYAGSLKALWLIDSATLITLAVVLGFLAARPGSAAPTVVVLLALIPAATGVLLYTFIGPFLPAHMLLTAAVLAGIAGWLLAR